jgi:hypothetical protein
VSSDTKKRDKKKKRKKDKKLKLLKRESCDASVKSEVGETHD